MPTITPTLQKAAWSVACRATNDFWRVISPAGFSPAEAGTLTAYIALVDTRRANVLPHAAAMFFRLAVQHPEIAREFVAGVQVENILRNAVFRATR